MQHNKHSPRDIKNCSGDCYAEWREETGGVAALAAAKAEAEASASPAELGKTTYAGCVACHGAQGQGGVGPQLAGQSTADIAGKLTRYRNGETLGAQSNLMWAQATQLDDADIDNLAAYIATL
jgi:cytochrome c553